MSFTDTITWFTTHLDHYLSTQPTGHTWCTMTHDATVFETVLMCHKVGLFIFIYMQGYLDQRQPLTSPLSTRLLQLLLSRNVREVGKQEVCTPWVLWGTGDRGGWLDKLIIYVSVRAHSLLNNHKKLRPHAAICTHATKCTGTFCWSRTGGASCKVYSLHQKDTSDISDRSQMMMRRDLLPLQRQNKRTDMKEKSINIRRLIKHAFFGVELTTKVLTVFVSHNTTKRRKSKKCWVTWPAVMLSFPVRAF